MKEYLHQLKENPNSTAVKVPAVVLVMLNSDAQVLLVQEKGSTEWSLPVAAIKAEQTPLDCAVGLAKEHVGVTLVDVDCVGYASALPQNQITLSDGAQVHLHNLVFASTYFEGDVALDTALYDACSYESIAKLPLLCGFAQDAIALFTNWLPTRVLQFS